jgi:type II secretory pathway component PulL
MNEKRPKNEKRWFAQWKVWLCLVILFLLWLISLPFRILDRIF